MKKQKNDKAANTNDLDEGPIYTKGSSFRARAEARARRFRVEVLHVAHDGKHGHKLAEGAVSAGANFLHPAARAAAEARAALGKGVSPRTFNNMLASQAMGFNIFGPLASEPSGLDIARDALRAFIPDLQRVASITMEYTPARDVFRDQSGRGGVDCDVLVEFEGARDERGVLVIETKLVEPGFSECGHRTSKKKAAGTACPEDVVVGSGFAGCRYASKNKFAYWERTKESRSLHLAIVERVGCPFGGPLWQLWVNHTLAHVEAARRGAQRIVFAVCAPEANDALKARATLDQYRTLAADADTVVFIPLERLLQTLVSACSARDAWRVWAGLVQQRYAVPPR